VFIANENSTVLELCEQYDSYLLKMKERKNEI